MAIHRYYHPFWFALTVVLSVLFLVLFLPVARSRHDLGASLALTGLGIAVIWIVYLVRAAIFSRLFGSSGPDAGSDRIR